LISVIMVAGSNFIEGQLGAKNRIYRFNVFFGNLATAHVRLIGNHDQEKAGVPKQK
jgi:hypothetical protein